MCCLFGILDMDSVMTTAGRTRALSILAKESEARGKDATGIAYLSGGTLRIYKRPKPSHKLRFLLRGDANLLMGHTRMATQGDAQKNQNNHPFRGKIGDYEFALAHNGVLYNDKELRREYDLPTTDIETDSYVAVQLLEKEEQLSIYSLGKMAEKLHGTFTFTVMDECGTFYVVRGNNPFCMAYYPKANVYIYASTKEILNAAIGKMHLRLGKPEFIQIGEGDILKITPDGKRTFGSFQTDKLYPSLFTDFWTPRMKNQYIEDLKFMALRFGQDPEDVDNLLSDGFSLDEIEEFIYCSYSF